MGGGTEVLERYSLLNLALILAGGSLAAWLINPTLDAGPVRVTSYALFAVGSTLAALTLVSILRGSTDGRGPLLLVASAYAWCALAVTFWLVAYLVLARAVGFLPHIPDAAQLRLSYFFIGGSAVGVAVMGVLMVFLPTRTLLYRRIPAWPLTALKGRRRR